MRFLRLIAVLAGLLCAAPALAQDEVDIALEQFGVGNAFRPGQIVPLRLQLTSKLADPVSVWVHVEVPNADGDIGEYGRFLSLTPNRPTLVWLWAPMPPENYLPSVFTVRVLAEVDGQTGRELGGARIAPSSTLRGGGSANLISMDKSVLGVIGRNRGNLGSLTIVPPPRTRPAGAIEDTRLVVGINPGDLPDRWQGLSMFDAILWTEDELQNLREDSARALTEYVQRGGHLVIALPATSDPWQLGRGATSTSVHGSIAALLPTEAPTRMEGVKITELLPALAKPGARVARDFDVTIRVFQNLADTGTRPLTNHYEPLIALPDGRVIVVQRTFGYGRITLIGCELTGQLESVNLPQGDVFWNRILGRRADTLISSELAAAEGQKLLMGTFGATPRTLGSGNLFTGLISHTGRALLGVLLALCLFAAYWILAGPGGYGLLRAYRQVKHSWVAFFGSSILFTGIAWIALKISPERSLEIKHFTVLDHVARPQHDTERPEDPQFQRATSWFSLYTPNYGSTSVRLTGERGLNNILIPWYPALTTQQRFPNTDRFRLDISDDRSAFRIPSRSTATQLYAHWLGGIDANWGDLIQPIPRTDGSSPIVVSTIGGNETSISGAITHKLPGELRNVKIVWIKNQRIRTRRYITSGDSTERWIGAVESGKMLNTGTMMSIASPWAPGEALSLDNRDYTDINFSLDRNLEVSYVNPYRSGVMGVSSTSLDSIGAERAIEMLSFFYQLKPPAYLKTSPNDNDQDNLYIDRMGGRELDLSAWFTRPCIIIIGYLDRTSLPIPIRINNSDVQPPSQGMTVIRWIYPLPVDSRIAFPPTESQD